MDRGYKPPNVFSVTREEIMLHFLAMIYDYYSENDPLCFQVMTPALSI